MQAYRVWNSARAHLDGLGQGDDQLAVGELCADAACVHQLGHLPRAAELGRDNAELILRA